MEKTHQHEVALVTGANKGIGFETARALGMRGMTVLVGARDAQRGSEAIERLRNLDVRAHFLPLDVADHESIDRAASIVEREHGRLDVLVNNAAIARGHTVPSGTSLDTVREIFETNVLGALATTVAFLPLLRKSRAPRIVNVSSPLGSIALHTDPHWEFAAYSDVGYCASKAALDMITVLFAKELGAGWKVNAAAPGYTKTDMNDNTGTDSVEDGARPSIRLSTLDADGPTAGFFDVRGRLIW